MTQLPDTPKPPASLRAIRVLAPLAALAMVIAVVVGLTGAAEGEAADLFANTWGVVTVVDLYLALLMGWAWIAWRERSVRGAILWAVLLITTGSIALWGYIAWRAMQARDTSELLLGPRDIGN